jgi:type VI secretion system protein ImpF
MSTSPSRQQDRLQPSLLDRLFDDAPEVRTEGGEARVINRYRLRELVLRDMVWLLNTAAPTGVDFTRAEHAHRSVLNYGVPTMAGQTLSTTDPQEVERCMRQAILDHEPRILPDTLQVQAIVNEDMTDHHNEIGLRISAQLWAQPVPLDLLLHTDIDLETGRVAVRELAR